MGEYKVIGNTLFFCIYKNELVDAARENCAFLDGPTVTHPRRPTPDGTGWGLKLLVWILS